MQRRPARGGVTAWGLLAVCLVWAAPAARAGAAEPAPEKAKPGEWVKLATRELPLASPSLALTPTLFDPDPARVIVFNGEGQTVDLGLPHEDADAEGKPLPPVLAQYQQGQLWVDANHNGKLDAGESSLLSTQGESAVFRAPVNYADGTAGTYAFCLRSLPPAAAATPGPPRKPGEGPFRFRLLRSTARSATFQGATILLFDDNNNGRYDDVGEDCIQVAGQPVALLGKTFLIRDKLFEIVVHPAGLTVEVRPAPPRPLGRLDFFRNFTPPQRADDLRVPTVIVLGREGSFGFSPAFPAADIPAGAYDLQFGLLERGKERVVVRKGARTSFDLEAGKVYAPAWGAPIACEFVVETSRKSERSDVEARVSVPPALRGSAGEVYLPQDYRNLTMYAYVYKVYEDRQGKRVMAPDKLAYGRFATTPFGQLKPLTLEYKDFADRTDAVTRVEMDFEIKSGIFGALRDVQVLRR